MMTKFFSAIMLLAISSIQFSTPKANEVAIKWMTWEEMQAAQKKKPKKVFVDVYTDWCGWCKKMDKTTFEHPVIAKYISEHYYAVKFNAEMKGDVIFKGEKFSTEGRYNRLATFLMNHQMSFPTTLYLDEQLNLLTTVPGYLEPATAEQILHYFGSDSFKHTKWETYQQQFKGKL